MRVLMGRTKGWTRDQTLRMGSMGQWCMTRRATTMTTVATPAIAVRIQKTFMATLLPVLPRRSVASPEDVPTCDVFRFPRWIPASITRRV